MCAEDRVSDAMAVRIVSVLAAVLWLGLYLLYQALVVIF